MKNLLIKFSVISFLLFGFYSPTSTEKKDKFNSVNKSSINYSFEKSEFITNTFSGSGILYQAANPITIKAGMLTSYSSQHYEITKSGLFKQNNFQPTPSENEIEFKTDDSQWDKLKKIQLPHLSSYGFIN